MTYINCYLAPVPRENRAAYEDEFCLILSGKAMLRYGDKTIEVKAGDAISFPRGERVAHQFYNLLKRPLIF